jgi:hypothetical protein
MSTFEEIQNMWDKNQGTVARSEVYDHNTFEKIVRSRAKRYTNAAMQYFWAAFVLQIVVYALFGHVMIKYAFDIQALLLSVAGVLLYLPFTIMLMKKYKRIALARPEGNTVTSLFTYVMTRYNLLKTFYTFKKRYELVLIPLSSMIGVLLVFNLYVPGGAVENITGAIITFGITLASCALAIRLENKKHFDIPLRDFRMLMEEFKVEA